MRGGDAAGGGAGQVPVPGRGLAARPARVRAQGLPRAQVRVAACREYLTRVIIISVGSLPHATHSPRGLARVPHGGHLTVTCHSGYRLAGAATLRCDHGTYDK